jgi:virginiamycin B lyase
MTTEGVLRSWRLPISGSDPAGIAVGPDHALWFACSGSIGRITTRGEISQYEIPSEHGALAVIPGPDGAMWFSEGGRLGRITPNGHMTEFPAQPFPIGSIAWHNGQLWFVGKRDRETVIGTLRYPGTVDWYKAIPNVDGVVSLLFDDEGALWLSPYYPGNQILRITTKVDPRTGE